MDPVDERLYDQLVAYLAGKGTVREDFAAGVLTLSAFDGRPLDPPVRLHVTPDELGRHLRATAPSTSQLEASWDRFVAQIGECVESAGPGATELVVDAAGPVARVPE